MKIFSLFCLLSFTNLNAQLSISNKSDIIAFEKKMQRASNRMIFDTSQMNRQKSTYEFIKLLKDALKIEGSFQYKFDSIQYISKAYSPDSLFRIFTFQLTLNNRTVRHYGCIQLNKKGSKIIPLIDHSDTFPLTPQERITNKNWFGAVYYKIISKNIGKQKQYFVFGFDPNDVFSSKKMVEPIEIVGDSMAYFGKPMFEKTTTKKDPLSGEVITKKEILHRYIVEYSAQANISLNYDESKGLITHDHVTSKNAKLADLSFTKIPDGSYEGLKWEKDKWIWQNYIQIGEKELKTDWDALTASDSTKAVGHEQTLKPEKSFVSQRYKAGID
jgi:hypothetical protein